MVRFREWAFFFSPSFSFFAVSSLHQPCAIHHLSSCRSESSLACSQLAELCVSGRALCFSIIITQPLVAECTRAYSQFTIRSSTRSASTFASPIFMSLCFELLHFVHSVMTAAAGVASAFYLLRQFHDSLSVACDATPAHYMAESISKDLVKV